MSRGIVPCEIKYTLSFTRKKVRKESDPAASREIETASGSKGAFGGSGVRLG